VAVINVVDDFITFMGDIIDSFFSHIINWVNDGFEGFVSALPDSPFSYLATPPEVSLGLSWFNWFVPLSDLLTILVFWLVAMFVLLPFIWLFRFIGVLP